jgi:Pentapeptide repeats (8 copies)
LSVSFVTASILVLAVDLLIFAHPISSAVWTDSWHWYHHNRADITPLGTFAGAAVVAWAALRQAKTARLRHEKQTDADRRRRITESFSKAAEMLGNDKIEVCLGGIYTMERISQESPEDYWPVMETITAFVRERARWKDPNEDALETLLGSDEAPGRQSGDGRMPTDIAAVLSVIRRRDEANHERERRMRWRFDLRGTDLRGARFYDAHLEGAYLMGAHLEGADLIGTHLEGAFLKGAHLERAWLLDAHLERANLQDVTGFDEGFQLDTTHGDASTTLPEDVARPAAWPPAQR